MDWKAEGESVVEQRNMVGYVVPAQQETFVVEELRRTRAEIEDLQRELQEVRAAVDRLRVWVDVGMPDVRRAFPSLEEEGCE